jgi:cytoskeletal protein RodZ
MQLNEILEENTIKGISQKTKISEDNLENLLAANFDALKKIKTLGFISILEREYKADLSALREEALAYYSQEKDEHGFTVVFPTEEEKSGKSKLFLFVVLALLGYASWYFFTQFDKKHLSELIPFMDEQMIETTAIETEEMKEEITVEDLSIANVVVHDTNTNTAVEDVAVQKNTQSSESLEKEVNISVEPVTQF